MRKIIFTMLFFNIISTSLFSLYMPGFHFSANLPFYSGSGFTTGYFDELELEGYSRLRNNPKLSLSFGISLSFYINKYFVIQPEINMNNNGGGLSGKSSKGDDYTRLIDETSLELPLFFKIRIPIKDSSITLFSGPGLTLLVDSPEIKNIEGYEFKTVSLSRDNFAILGFMIECGVGYDIPFNEGVSSFEIRYSYELTDTVDSYEGSFNQNCLSFLIGYSFNKKDSK